MVDVGKILISFEIEKIFFFANWDVCHRQDIDIPLLSKISIPCCLMTRLMMTLHTLSKESC